MGGFLSKFMETAARDSMVSSGQSAYGEIHTPEQKATLAAIDSRDEANPLNPKMASAISSWLKADPNNFQTAIDRTRSQPNGDLELYDNLYGSGFATLVGSKGLNDQKSNFAQIGDWVNSTYDWMNKDPNGFQAWADSDPRNATRFFSRLALGDVGLGGQRSIKDNVFGMSAKDFNNTAAYYATQEAVRRGMGEDNKEDGKTISYEYSGDVSKGLNNAWGSGDFYKIGNQNSMKGGLKDFISDNPLETAGLIALAAFGVPAAAGAAGAAAGGTATLGGAAAAGAAGGATAAGGASLITGQGLKDSLSAALKGGLTGAVTGGVGHFASGVSSSLQTAGVPKLAADTALDTANYTIANGGDPVKALQTSLLSNGINWSADKVNQFLSSLGKDPNYIPLGSTRASVDDTPIKKPTETFETGPMTDGTLQGGQERILPPEGHVWTLKSEGSVPYWEATPIGPSGGGGSTGGGGYVPELEPLVLEPSPPDWDDPFAGIDAGEDDQIGEDSDIVGPTLGALAGLAGLGGGSGGGDGTGEGSGTGSGSGTGTPIAQSLALSIKPQRDKIPLSEMMWLKYLSAAEMKQVMESHQSQGQPI
jgi:hypothetical protein